MKAFLASCLLVCITEISPHKINDESEWFEFYTEQEVSEIKNWKISNGKSMKNIIEVKQGDDKNIFYLQKSPLSLPNDGGVLQILDAEDQILDQVTYPKTKSGTRNKLPYIEYWNRSDTNTLIPLLSHTKGQESASLPSPEGQVHIQFTEVSPKHKTSDFIKLTVLQKANLKNMQIKHNGSVIKSWESHFEKKSGDEILISNLKLSSGSGTLEIILNTGTSHEKIKEVLCWQKEKLSKTEQNRVDKFIQADLWYGPCVDIIGLVTNEKIVRQNQEFIRVLPPEPPKSIPTTAPPQTSSGNSAPSGNFGQKKQKRKLEMPSEKIIQTPVFKFTNSQIHKFIPEPLYSPVALKSHPWATEKKHIAKNTGLIFLK